MYCRECLPHFSFTVAARSSKNQGRHETRDSAESPIGFSTPGPADFEAVGEAQLRTCESVSDVSGWSCAEWRET